MTDSSTSFALSDESAAERRRVRVLLPLPLDGAYDYAAPGEMALEPGDFVRVPLAGRWVAGVIWDDDAAEPLDRARLKPVAERYAAPRMAPAMRRLIDWIAAYTVTPPGAVLRMAMGPRDVLFAEDERAAFAPAPWLETIEPGDRRFTAARRRVLDILADGPPMTAAAAAREAGCGAGVVRSMVEAGLLVETRIAARGLRPVPDWRLPFPPFSDAQREAAAAICQAVAARRFETFLLDGVTGSGKTLVYFKAVAAALESGRQALVLLPEIALGAQWHERFEQQFGCRAAAWHSGVNPTERRAVWRDVADGRARVVVGARSALFLPFRELGLIVVDEEHDASYKQEEGVIYHARDMAVVRARLEDLTVVLASATPALETLVNADRGRYRRIVLPERHGGADLPDIELLDLRVDRLPRQSFLSPRLTEALAGTLAEGEQAMLFLNRRGYAPLTLCRGCGHRLQCPNCTAWLVEHRLLGRLACHHCGHAERLPQTCPSCGEKQSFAPCGPGVERVAEEVARLFPDARTAVMASDTLHGPDAIRQMVRQVEAGELDILIGTQVMAKGHHFPMLTLVGVVDADLGLNGGDLRAAERTFQLLHQVAGRAGRADRPGRVMLQTYDAEHPVMVALASGDRDRFLALERDERRRHCWPPFGRLAALIVSGPDDEQADRTASAIARAAPHVRGITVLGPAPAPLAVLRGRHRRRFLVKAERHIQVQPMLRAWLGGVRVPSSVRIQVDVDPYSFM
jgi:primosomal protein N' (replication factor Y)